MPSEIRILGPDGRPIRSGELTREIATPTLTGLRQVWSNTVASGLTPGGLAALLGATIHGDAHDYLVLAEEMEERDPHYAAVLGVRKRAVTGLPPVVAAATDEKRDVEVADAVRELTARPEFGCLLEDLLDGLGKGYSVVEILWDKSGNTWKPKNYRWRDPRWFCFDRLHEQLRLRDEADPVEGIELAPYKFIRHVPRLKSGIALRGGIARMVAFSWICKAYALKDWMAFVEVFGMPLRIGRYGPNASTEDVSILRSAVANLGSDAAAVLPDSMKIEFQETGGGAGGPELFRKLCEYLDMQVSKAVLGQTMTTDAQSAGLGSNQANVHNEVRGDILQADARQLADTLNRDLVRPFIDLNFGPQENYPRIELQIAEPENIAALTSALKELVPMGLKVETSVIRDKLGLPDPEDGAEVLIAPAVAPVAAPAINHQTHENCPRCATARNARDDVDRDAIDDLADEGLLEWQEQLEPTVSAIEKLAAECRDHDEFLARLPELLKDVEPGELVRQLALGAFKARVLGETEDLGRA